VTGIAVPYDQWAVIGGDFREKFVPGAYRGEQPSNQFAYRNHGWDEPLGSTEAGTLVFRDTPEGLRFELELPDTTRGRDMAVLAKRGDIKGASLGFRVRDNEWRFAEKPGELDERTVTDVEVLEVSLTHMPAYRGATASLRSTDLAESRAVHQAAKQQREAELAAREREAVLLEIISKPRRS
jgi:HK97 family phage prohead protease